MKTVILSPFPHRNTLLILFSYTRRLITLFIIFYCIVNRKMKLIICISRHLLSSLQFFKQFHLNLLQHSYFFHLIFSSNFFLQNLLLDLLLNLPSFNLLIKNLFYKFLYLIHFLVILWSNLLLFNNFNSIFLLI